MSGASGSDRKGTAGGGADRGGLHRARAFWIVHASVIGVFTFLAMSRMWRGAGFGDFHVFHDAFVAVLSGQDLYDSGIGGYIYPPLFAVVFAPLGWLSLNAAGAVYTAVNGALAFACFWLAASETLRRFDARADRAALPAIMLFALAVFGDKVRIELQGGQTDLWILLCVLLSLRWLGTRPILAGFMLGLAGNLKYQSLIVLPYLLLRGRWRALLSSIASMVGLAFSSALVFGWQRNLDYLERAFGGLAGMVGLGSGGADAANVQQIAWIRSISLPSVFARVQEWAGLPGYAMPLMTLAAAGLCMGAVFLIYRSRGERVLIGRVAALDDAGARGRAVVLLEWMGLLVAVMVFGPQTNARHMLLMLPLGTVAGMLVLVPPSAATDGARETRSRWIVLASAVFLLLAFVLPTGSGDNDRAVNAWRWIGGISIATLTLLFVTLAAGLGRAHGLPKTDPGPP